MMANRKLLLIVLCCVGVVFCCQDSGDCRLGRKCVYKSNYDPEEYTLCTRARPWRCSCLKVCEYKGKYVVKYFNGCNWCSCYDPVKNTFMCTLKYCGPVDKVSSG